MATGKMSWQHYNSQQKPGAMYGGGQMAGDMQDMHLKMSKKIAQLTKVIYALNTKNDDHEAAMDALKDSHEEEMQQLLAETASKIQDYRLKIGNELDLRRKIRNLEDCVDSYVKERKLAMVEMDAYKQSVEEREDNLRRNNEDTISKLTRELLEAKGAFEQRIQDFDSKLSADERERNKNLDSVILDYRNQVQNLKEQLADQKKSFELDREKLKDSHEMQIRSLQSEIEVAKSELRKCMEDYDGKMEKAKSFYERELMALKASSMSDEELERQWKEREAILKKESSRVELSLRAKIKELTDELDIQRDEVQHLNEQILNSDAKANSTVDHIKDLREQLSRLQVEFNATTDKVGFLEDELSTARERIDSQAGDIIKKSSIIGTLEAIKLTQDESIRDLESQMKDMKRRYHDIEAERNALQRSQTDENGQLLQQLKVLGTRVETMANEKTTLQKQFQRDLDELKMTHEEEVDQLKQQFEKEAASMAKSHQSEVDLMKNETQDAMDKLLREMQDRIMRETSNFEEEKSSAIGKLEEERDLISKELKTAQQEIARLTDVISTHESGLGDASTRIGDLRSRIGDLENEVRDSDARRRTVETSADQVRRDMKHMQAEHDRKVSCLNSDHQSALEGLRKELDEKWEERMTSKLSELQSRLTSQHTDERREMTRDLEGRKEEEMRAAKEGWEEQIRQLAAQMSEMRHKSEEERREMERRLEERSSSMGDLERRLRNEALEKEEQFSSKVEHLEDSHKMALAALEQRKESEFRNLESRLQSEHREEMHSQMRAQQISLDALREQMRREKMGEMKRKEEDYRNDLEEVRSEMMHQQASAIDDVTRQYEGQLATTKSDLELQRQNTQRRDEEYNRKLSDLEMELRSSTSQLHNLRDKVTEQNESLSTVNRELEMKGHEILRVRSEANVEMRRREEELLAKFQGKQDRFEAEVIRQKQAMVNDFNRATEALKDKLSTLNIALREAEERFERRESRPEDVDMINQLKELVVERENQMQKLIDEKKYFQRELVNRETNFNKVFSTAPNVGVLNPRVKKKGQNPLSAPARFSNQFISVPNMNSLEPAITASNRLEPIRSGSTSPGSYSNGPGKHLQPTPPSHPKKFLRVTDDDNSSYQQFSNSFSTSKPANNSHELSTLRSNGEASRAASDEFVKFRAEPSDEFARRESEVVRRTTTFEPSGEISHNDVTMRPQRYRDVTEVWQRRSFFDDDGDLKVLSRHERIASPYGSLPDHYTLRSEANNTKRKSLRESFRTILSKRKTKVKK